MTYSISVSGHKDTATHEESVQFEKDQAAEARKCVAALEGVSSATFYGGNIGQVDLTKPE